MSLFDAALSFLWALGLLDCASRCLVCVCAYRSCFERLEIDAERRGLGLRV